jgi:hypothetical protein
MSSIPTQQPYTTYPYQQSHYNTLKTYVPNYQPKSDYLPSTVHEGSNQATNNYV